jgi:hypothetical protein
VKRLLDLLARPWAPWAVIALALVLELPSVTSGFAADDWFQLLVARGARPFAGLPRSSLDLFTFASGSPVRNLALMRAGVFPWTADPEAKLSFPRPLAAATHLLDTALAPDSAVFAHLHNLLWFALGLVALGLVYRQLFEDPRLAGLALLLYALDDARGPTVSWVANRNALIAFTLSCVAFTLHLRGRKGSQASAFSAPMVFAVALLAGESAIGALAWLGAYALCVETGPYARRAASLLPFGLVTAGWLAAYRLLGFGARNSGVYLDPVGEPVAFLTALPGRLGALLTAQLAGPWSDFSELYVFLSPTLPLVMTVLSWALVAAVALLAWPTLKRSATARFFALAMVLSAVPVCATFPADRLLTFIGFGGMGLLAMVLAERARGLARVGVGGLVVFHLVLAGPLQLLRSRSMVTVGDALRRSNASLPNTERTIIAINTPTDALAGYLLLLRAWQHDPLPAHFWWLYAGPAGLDVTRVDEHTLELRPVNGFVTTNAERMLRSRPFHAGERVDLGTLELEVTEITADGRPGVVMARLSEPFENITWVGWRDGAGYVAFTPPAPGQTVHVAPTDVVRAIFGTN